MQFNPDETFWDDLLTYVDSGCVIPVLGQGAITYGRQRPTNPSTLGLPDALPKS
jgi:hypothetical protein